MARVQPTSIRLERRSKLGAAESVRRELDRLDGSLTASELKGLSALVRTLVTAVPPDGTTTISLELWASERAVHLLAQYRCERVTGQPPDLHPGAFALVERCAPRWAAERTASETIVRAELKRERLAGELG